MEGEERGEKVREGPGGRERKERRGKGGREGREKRESEFGPPTFQSLPPPMTALNDYKSSL